MFPFSNICLDLEEDSSDDVSDKTLATVAQAIGSNWKLLGAMLDIRNPQLEHINEDGRTAVEKVTGMLHAWKKAKGVDASLEALLTAVKDTQELTVDWGMIESKVFDADQVMNI